MGLVLINHFGYPTVPISWIRGSPNIGVDIFFVLSGFLITRLLLDEQASSQRISVGRFWARRALRLLPVAVFVIAVVWVLAGLFGNLFYHSGSDVSMTRDAVAALTYHMNLLLTLPGQYHVSALTHTWSLSVEEQFYLVWPIVVVLLVRARPRQLSHAAATAIAAALVVIGSSTVRLASWQHGDRVYNGLDSRAGQLCAGACLAGLSMCAPHVLVRFTRLAWLGMAGLLISGLRVGIGRWGSLGYDLVAGMTVLVLTGVVMAPRSSLDRVLSQSVLVWIGVRSYAIYLVHFPLFLAATPERFSSIPLPMFLALRAAVAVGLAEVIHRLIEQPVAQFGKRAHLGAQRRVPPPAQAIGVLPE